MMTPVFVRINFALNHTREYFEIGRIVEHLRKMAGEPNLDYLDQVYNNTLTWHRHMEAEINQNIYGSNRNIQVHMFEYLKTWLADGWEFQPESSDVIYLKVLERIDNDIKEYNLLVEADELAFKEKIDLSRPNGSEYEVETPSILGMPAKKINVINRWFHCNERKVPFVDVSLLPKYIDFVKKIVDNFKSHCEKYINNYDTGKYVALTEISNEKALIEKQESEQEMLKSSQVPPKKLLVNFTAGQLLYLFQSLEKIGAFEPSIKNIEICRFLESNFSTRYQENLSAQNLSKVWSNIDPNDIAYWSDKLPDMNNQLIKDNPNRVKYNPKKIR